LSEKYKHMRNNIHIYKTPEELANEFAGKLMSLVEKHSGESFHMAISGGKTPDLLFSVLAENYPDSVLWQKIHFWWVDERMVSPENPESNFGVAQKFLFSKIILPEENIHRIKGENAPETEVLSYSGQIQNMLTFKNHWPVFDLILLGMGDDGHTASIFPNQMELLHSDRICEVATHPQSGQKRITLTGNVLNNSNRIIFLITGKNKADRIFQISNQTKETGNLPASHISPFSGNISWFLDENAAKKID